MQSFFSGLKSVGSNSVSALSKVKESIKEKVSGDQPKAEKEVQRGGRVRLFKRKRNIFIPEAPKPSAIPRLISPESAHNEMLGYLLQSAH
jgi:hypothetical protein